MKTFLFQWTGQGVGAGVSNVFVGPQNWPPCTVSIPMALGHLSGAFRTLKTAKSQGIKKQGDERHLQV